MEETGFGVFEDKVVKNYIATEFLYDYLKDKRSVGVIDEDPERGIEYVAEPIGVVLALAADHQPDLDRAVQGDRRGEDAQRDDLPARRRARRAARRGRSRSSRRPARPRACRRDALQVIPDPTLDVSQYLFHHPGVDFIWTTGGPEGGRRDERGRQAVHQRRPRQRAGLRPPQRRRARWRSSTSSSPRPSTPR